MTLSTLVSLAMLSPGFNLDLQVQGSLGVLARVPEARGFGGVELYSAASVFGLGFVAAAGYERTPEAVDGGYFFGAFQARPLAWSDHEAHRDIDLHVAFGGLLGALEGPSFRGAVVVALGADVPVIHYGDDEAIALFVQYRVELASTQEEATTHLLMLGLGVRVAQ